MARRPWTLRRQLIAAISLLLVVLTVLIGLVSVLALRGYLIDRLDDQLAAATSRFQIAVGRPDGPYGGEHPDSPAPFLPLAGLPPGAIGAFITDAQIQGAILGDELATTYLTDEQAAALRAVPVDGSAVTVDLGKLGEYRVAATPTDAGETAIIGLPLADVESTVLQLITVIALVAAGGLVVVLIVGTAIVRFALRPLDRVVATATHVAELPLDRGEVALSVRVPEEDAQPSTEVGTVGAAINHMLGNIANALTAREASERKVRTFVADASHELRTPLASIRGYAELTRRGGHELPDDVVRAMGRIESESVRMTSLVEDLLLLARLDDGRELESAPVDLGSLLADAVGDAEAAGQDHEWRFDPPDEPVVVPGDAARLHQVLVNVLGNARTHTPAGTVVTASIAVAGDRAIISIQDDGPGIAPDLQSSIFERFVRGDSSRSRAAGSTGLGLAIVAAVVDAHGGTVAVASEPGMTVFTVSLPLAS